MKKALWFLLLCLPVALFAQQPRTINQSTWQANRAKDSVALRNHSAHAEFQKQFPSTGKHSEAYYDSLQGNTYLKPKVRKECTLSTQVFGFHPSWMGSAYKSYDYGLLSTLSFFSATVNPATGDFSSTGGWESTPVVDSALKHNVRVELTIANLGSAANAQLLPNASACQKLIDQSVGLVKARNANGITVDFEQIPSANKQQFTDFVTRLSQKLKEEMPGAGISICLYAVDWDKVFDIPSLTRVVDRFVIMGYDYYVNGSSTAGPVAPLRSGTEWAPYNLDASTQYYLKAGVPPGKLILAIPYYGRQWKVSGNELPSKNAGFVATVTYSDYAEAPQKYGNPVWDDPSATNYRDASGGAVMQTWLEDSTSLGAKYDYVQQQKIGGVGIFALGYDNGSHHLWDLLRNKFTVCVTDSMKQANEDSVRQAMEDSSGIPKARKGTGMLTFALLTGGLVFFMIIFFMWKKKK